MPTVIRSDSGQLAIDGTLATDSVMLFNGIDLMDPYSGEYRVRLPLESVDRVDLYIGVAPAQYGDTVGGVVDISTLPGGESWEWGVASFFPRPRFRDGTIQGIGNASPRLRVSGPIKPGETYMALSGEYHFDRVDVQDVPGDPAQDHIKVQGWDATAQVDWRPNDQHSLTVSGLAFPQYDQFVGLDGLTPPEATFNVERDAEALFAKHTYRANSNRSLETMIQYNRIGIRSEPQGAAPYEVLTDGFGGNQFHAEDRQTTHTQIQVNYSRHPGRGNTDNSHLVQIGADFHRLAMSGQFSNDTILVRGVDGRLLQRVGFTDSPDLLYKKYEWAGYFQDRWTHSDRFWFDIGVRLSGDSFTETAVRIGPRIGAAWDPAGDRRTLLKVGAGILYRRVYLGEILWQDLPTRLETTFSEDGSATLVPLVAVRDEDLSAPRTLLFTGDFSHRLESGWLLRTKFSHRSGRNNIIAERVEPPGVVVEDDDPLPFFTQNPNIEAGALLLSNAGESTSWSLEITAAKRITSGGELVVSYVRSSSFSDLNDFTIMSGDAPDPIIRENRRAQRALDVPHRVLVWATINLPAGVQLAPVFEWRTGFPYSLLAEDQSYFGEPNTERFPNFFLLDLQATKSFTVGGVFVVGGVKVTNITSHDNPRQVIANVADPAFGEFRNSIPVRLRAKFSFNF